MNVLVVDDVLKDYFYSWRPYKVIIARLEEVHGLKRSVSWLRKQFKRLSLKRRPASYTPRTIVANCITKELRGSGASVGYRAMWKILREKYLLSLKRNTVMELLRELDCKGVLDRASRRLKRRRYSSKGPNYVWHIDGYDKLKAFGFPIHGCVDGVRMDCGTENVTVAAIQFAFRSRNDGEESGRRSFMYGTSHANVRVESMWAQLKKNCSGWWMRVFKELREQGFYCGVSILHKRCLAVVFQPIIERELNNFKVYWNTHKIRKSHGDTIDGIPDDLYQMPVYYGAEEYKQSINSQLWTTAMSTLSKLPEPMYSNQFYERSAQLVQDEFGLDLYIGI